MAVLPLGAGGEGRSWGDKHENRGGGKRMSKILVLTVQCHEVKMGRSKTNWARQEGGGSRSFLLGCLQAIGRHQRAWRRKSIERRKRGKVKIRRRGKDWTGDPQISMGNLDQ